MLVPWRVIELSYRYLDADGEELCDAPDLVDASRMALALFRDTLADHEGRHAVWNLKAGNELRFLSYKKRF